MTVPAWATLQAMTKETPETLAGILATEATAVEATKELPMLAATGKVETTRRTVELSMLATVAGLLEVETGRESMSPVTTWPCMQDCCFPTLPVCRLDGK